MGGAVNCAEASIRAIDLNNSTYEYVKDNGNRPIHEHTKMLGFMY